ncbi:tRNA-binding protein [Calothrix sp. NIES-3974]|uniref:tRNA-binding protein n=1 Tax=Calothrix sp. NIES-3974 TaxID=2005462 RepID=UPI000B5F36D0|nr:tRNA-binding protein [Calothrix sp. NIES-3974]BAZ06403.1 export-related chaperone CsaA [Calothrix sp. NIES-3974]
MEQISPQPLQILDFETFLQVDMRVGTIIEVQENIKAKKPAYILKIDFGELGIKTSSAQIVENYTKDDLLHRQIVAVMNFPPKLVAGVKSEVLVLAAVCDFQGTVLLQPNLSVKNGVRIM